MEIQELISKKMKLLLLDKDGRRYLQCTFDPSELSPCKTFIRFGNYHWDQVSGWYSVAQVANDVVSVLAEHDDGQQETNDESVNKKDDSLWQEIKDFFIGRIDKPKSP